MITASGLSDNQAFTQEITAGSALPNGTVWVDAQGCSESELAALSQIIRQPIPAIQEVRLLEQARQHYARKGTTYLTAPLIIGSQSELPIAGTLLFILCPTLLVTVHSAPSRALNQFADSLARQPEHLASSEAAFVGVLENLVQRLADLAETMAYDLEQVGRIVLSESVQRARAPGQGRETSWRKIMLGLGRTARLNHRLLTTLTGLDRLLAFVQTPQEPRISPESYPRLKLLQEDIARQHAQASAQVEEASFLLNAIVGAISVEQNNVIKIFSMVAVVLMPPTMIASIYGMNFAHMPELAQPWGYPLALLGMLLSGLIPWLWFKRSGWF